MTITRDEIVLAMASRIVAAICARRGELFADWSTSQSVGGSGRQVLTPVARFALAFAQELETQWYRPSDG